MKPTLMFLTALLLVSFETNAATPLADKVDWPAFMARHDLVFETLPTQFDCGAFLGNGLLGAMIYRDGDTRLRFEMGRADVTEHRRDNNRLPIGGLVLETASKIRDGTMRLDLWNAEVRGTVTTDKGTIQFRALIHTDMMAMILDLETSDGEKAAKFVWVPGLGQDKRNQQEYLHYRHSMDHTLITNQSQHAFYPLLRGSINLYLRLLTKGTDGKLHLPVQHSPEYGNAADNNYNLALLRWGCQTLIDLNQRYRLNDPLLPRWQETLANLTPYPVDETGLRVGSDMAFTKSHRHWSHLLMVHPLHIMDANDPANRDLLYQSIHHWLTVDGGSGVYGWSRAAAASLYAALGDGDNAIASIHQYLSDKRFVRPNTMYIEGSPVIECSIVLARSLQDMLIQSHSNLIRVFPAVPAAWSNAIFHNLRTEGAFLVSAERKAGKTQWVRVKSLAGEPCRIQFDGRIHELQLAKGEEKLLGDGPAMVEPLPTSELNPHGLKKSEKP